MVIHFYVTLSNFEFSFIMKEQVNVASLFLLTRFSHFWIIYRFLSQLSLGQVVEHLDGLLYAVVEKRPVLHEQLDLLDGKFNQNTRDRDLESPWYRDIFNVLVDNIAYLVFVVWVLRRNSV